MLIRLWRLKSIIGGNSASNSNLALSRGDTGLLGTAGGGRFYWDASSSSGDNGVTPTQPGTIIVPTGSNSARWLRIYSGPINVRWFGARGQGTNDDDTPAINKAISVAGASGIGAEVFIPRGIYRLNESLNMSFASVRLHGEGEGATFLEKVGTSAETIIFKSTSGQCEVARIPIRPRRGSAQTTGEQLGLASRWGRAVSKA